MNIIEKIIDYGNYLLNENTIDLIKKAKEEDKNYRETITFDSYILRTKNKDIIIKKQQNLTPPVINFMKASEYENTFHENPDFLFDTYKVLIKEPNKVTHKDIKVGRKVLYYPEDIENFPFKNSKNIIINERTFTNEKDYLQVNTAISGLFEGKDIKDIKEVIGDNNTYNIYKNSMLSGKYNDFVKRVSLLNNFSVDKDPEEVLNSIQKKKNL